MPQMQECYIEPDESWLLKLALQDGCVELCVQNYRLHAIFACITFWKSTILVMHTWGYKRDDRVHF